MNGLLAYHAIKDLMLLLQESTKAEAIVFLLGVTEVFAITAVWYLFFSPMVVGG